MSSAFGASGLPVPLSGGQGSSWRVGDLVLKPADVGEEELRWQEETLERIGRDGFRFAQPLRAANGSLLVEGWCARAWLPGGHGKRRWREIIAAGERFHAALSSLTRPGFLDSFFAMSFLDQFLLRALIYRAVTDALFRGNEPPRPDDSDPFLPAVEIACRYAAAC